MPIVNMTERWVRSARAIDGKRTDYSDRKSRGLYLRVTPAGAKSWAVIYRRKSDNRQRRLTLAPIPNWGWPMPAGRRKRQ